jgi:SAM-dependent methyltransferase
MSEREIRCVLCRSPAMTARNSPGTARCTGCGLIFVTPALDERTSINLQLNCPIHDETGRGDTFRVIEAVARARLGGAGTALDVGCGGGAFMRLLQARGWHAVGIDVNEHALERAREYNLDARLATLQELDSGIDQFDCVVLMNALEYMANWMDELRRAAELLRPGGVLVLETPNASYHRWQARIGSALHLDRNRLMIIEAAPGRRLVSFSPRAARLALAKTGLEQVEIEPALPRVAGGPAEQVARRVIFGAGRIVHRLLPRHPLVSPSMIVIGTRPPS